MRDNDTNEYLAEIDAMISATFIPRYNDVGTYEVVLRYDSSSASQYFAGPNALNHPGIALLRGDKHIMSGPMQAIDRTYDSSGDILTIYGVSDMIWPYNRVTVPDPVLGAGHGDFYSAGPASVGECLSQLLYDHCVRTELGRSIPSMSIGDVGDVGPVVFNQSRYANVLSTMQEIATGNNIAFDIVDLSLLAWVPTNQGCVFSVEQGTMTSYINTVTMPKWNFNFTGGKTPTDAFNNPLYASQQIDTSEDSASESAWNRIETYYDRQDILNPPAAPATADFLQQVSDENLIPGQSPVGYQVAIIETDQQIFGVHFNVGDIATVTVPGTTWTDIVRDTTITFSGNNPVTVQPTIGIPARPGYLAQLGQFSRQVRRLQTV